MTDELTRRLELTERRLADARADARSLASHNQRLGQTLAEVRAQLVELRDASAALSQPPLARALVLDVGDGTLDVVHGNRWLRVRIAPEFGPEPARGTHVLLNEALVAVAPAPAARVGELGVVREVLDDLAVVGGGQADDALFEIAPGVGSMRVGDVVRLDRVAGLVLGVLPRVGVEEVSLDEVPDVTWTQIGGLATQLEQIRDAVELPVLHRDAFARYRLSAPKGILLYGPPGCGKTMIAKAVANSLSAHTASGRSHFLNIKGPELLSKFVGSSEEQIRKVFARARELSAGGDPTIIFFDEMDALFRTRGSGISSDIENTLVAQFLSELDGVEQLSNVIVIGASNREELIDPAVLRPGRLDVKIRLSRPDATDAAEIVGKYLTADLPLAGEVDALIAATVAAVYDEGPVTALFEVTYVTGETRTFHFADVASGAMLRNIVDRAKLMALKSEIAGGVGGISADVLRAAARAEFTENEDLFDVANPDAWAGVTGLKGATVSRVRRLGPTDAS